MLSKLYYKYFYKLMQFLSKFIIYPKYNIKYIHKERAKNIKGPLLMCGNHLTNSDPMIITFKFKKEQIKYMGKKELFEKPISRFVFKNLGVIPVDRGKNDTQAIERCKEIIKNGGILGIFPEGRRNVEQKEQLLRFKSGAFYIAKQTKCDIMPVVVKMEKTQKKFFRKYYVIFGNIIPFEKFCLESDDKKVFSNAKKILKQEMLNLLNEVNI